MSIGIYARVSTEEQVKKGYSLKDQIRACRNFAHSDDITEFIDEGISGEILDRPELTKLRQAVREGKITKVICLDPDRLSRKLMNQLILSEEIEKRAKLVFVNGEYNQTAEGKLFYQLRGAISEFEKAKINERMSRGRREKARQGKVVRDYSVYGYDYDKKTQQFVINQFEAEIVKIIFRLFTEKNKKTDGINGIAKYLTSQGIPTKRGALVWHREVVRKLLKNRTYIGEFYQNRWNTEGTLGNQFRSPEERIPVRERPKEDWILVPCPPIVDAEVFYYAQELLKESRRRWAGSNKNSYLLKGLVRCGVCGNTMPGRCARNWGKQVLEYCDIKNTADTLNRGCGMRIKTEVLDRKIWETVFHLLNHHPGISPENTEVDNHAAITSLENSEMIKIEKRIQEIKQKRNNLINLIENTSEDLGKTYYDEINQRLKALKVEEDHLVETFKRVGIKELQDAQMKYPVNLLKEASDYYLLKAPHEINFEDQFDLIHYLIREVVVYKDEIKILGF